MTRKAKFFVCALLLLFSVLVRVMPHPWNATPVAAMSLFAGAYLGVGYALSLPIATMLVSDAFVGFYALPVLVSVYLSFLLIACLGVLLRRQRNPETMIGASLAGSIFFYLITNYAVWQFTPYYEKSLAGLQLSYALALPFFRNTLVGDLFYTGIIFGGYALARWVVGRVQLRYQPQA